MIKSSTKNGLSTKSCVNYISGPVKIHDGLFMGDQVAAKDIDFIVSNKVTHIINTVVKKIPNLYQRFGVQYLSVNWTEKQQNIFDKKYNALSSIASFIDEAMDQGQSVLIHSQHGKSRAGSVVIAYLMKKYCWSLQKSIDFVISVKSNFQIRSNFMHQLSELQKSISQQYSLSNDWKASQKNLDIILINTYKNKNKNKSTILENLQQNKKKSKKRVSWGEKVIISSNYKSPTCNILTSNSKYRQFLQQSGCKTLKPILKNFQQQQAINKSEQKSENKECDIDEKQEKIQVLRMSQRITSGIRDNTIVNNYTTIEKSERYASVELKQTHRQKQKKLESKSGSRLARYENIISSVKSPYDINFLSRIGENSRKKYDNRQYQTSANFYEKPNYASNELKKQVAKERKPFNLKVKQDLSESKKTQTGRQALIRFH